VRANTALVKREMAGQTNDAAMLFGTLAHAFRRCWSSAWVSGADGSSPTPSCRIRSA
jgi:hypothetical protein